MSKLAHQEFESYLFKTGSRYTIQKRLIVEEISKIQSHFEIDDFLLRKRTQLKNISRATLYRTIKQLLEAKMVQKITTKTGQVFYEQNFEKQTHAHLICNTCGKIQEISEETINHWINTYCKLHNFIPEYKSIQIFGNCCHSKSK